MPKVFAVPKTGLYNFCRIDILSSAIHNLLEKDVRIYLTSLYVGLAMIVCLIIISILVFESPKFVWLSVPLCMGYIVLKSTVMNNISGKTDVSDREKPDYEDIDEEIELCDDDDLYNH